MKKYTIIYLLLFFTLGCSDNKIEPAQIDDIGINISINPVHSDNIIWNTTKVSMEVSDLENLEKIELYLDDKIIESFINIPSSFTFNTRNYDNGDYILKAIAYDKKGHKTVSNILNIKIYNYLLEINVGDQATFDGNRFLIITENDGTLIEIVNAINVGSLKVDRPEDFNDSTFAIHEIRTSISRFNGINSVFSIKPGKIKVGEKVYKEMQLGETLINFKDIPDFNYATTSNGNNGQWTVYLYLDTISLPVYKDCNDSFFFMETTNGPGYLMIKNLTEGGNREVSLNDLNYDMDQLEFNLSNPNYELGSIQVKGYSELSNKNAPHKTFFYKDFNNSENTFINIPSNDPFSDYETIVSAKNDGVYEYNRNFGEISQEFNFFDGSISINDGHLKSLDITVKGAYDLILMEWYSYGNTDDYYWRTFGQDTSKPAYPEVTEEVLAIYPWIEDKKFVNNTNTSYGLKLYEFDGIDNYDQYIDGYFLRSDEKLINKIHAEKSIYTWNDLNTSNGGRSTYSKVHHRITSINGEIISY